MELIFLFAGQRKINYCVYFPIFKKNSNWITMNRLIELGAVGIELSLIVTSSFFQWKMLSDIVKL